MRMDHLPRLAAGLLVSASVLVLLGLGADSALARMGDAPLSLLYNVSNEASIETIVMPPVDADRLLQEDIDRAAAGIDGPLRFAQPHDVYLNLIEAGTLDELENGGRIWRLRFISGGAYSLNFGVTSYLIPPGGTLHLYPAGQVSADLIWEGPFDPDEKVEGEFWSPVIPGDDVIVELYVPADAAFEPEVIISQVNHDYRGFGKARDDAQQGWCNIDVICPEGDPWRDEIRSEGVYTINGSWMCSGQLVNSLTSSPTPFFLTAYHCGISTSNDHTVRVYWNYESPTCGQLGGGSLSDSQQGCTEVADYSASDFSLVEMTSTPAEASNVYYAGWDARTNWNPSQCTAIHHPGTDEKSISFNFDALMITSYIGTSVPGDGTHWRVDDWEVATTEGGSSGSAIWDENHHIVGQLHGGYASCSSITSDWYGRLAISWSGGGSSATNLRSWLDPENTGTLVLNGRDSNASAIENVEVLIHKGALRPISPNPAATRMGIGFDLHQAGAIQLDVVDVTGRVVTTLAAKNYQAGSWQLGWDGTSSSGERLSSGVYYVRMLIDGQAADTKKAVLVR
ncbi:MAG: hypothetical protein KJ970_17490 [Candidatus Eisenbacteria bacterium]|uniref:FlgD/Vpr Ig-like domain-containing protein n=1 Tax=Eiseniibacteriota bacterium TaxID=2212470 RepID=A0A948RZV3_UNCEI|nr:hypothetical protein [Candidatus Eisenbacteria bacterium]MBU1947557.1 hypothetical protein [Candidatus Eisenbacteria bacterium]MBU2692713.1 hypothetical protein [Candidatus Eisenbacteria bacterium]